MTTAFIFDETFDGLLSCVFTAYSAKIFPDKVLPSNNLQQDFMCRYTTVKTDCNQAERVRKGLIKTAGWRAFHLAYTAFMSDIPEIFTSVFNFICLAFRHKNEVLNLLTNENVLAVEKGSFRSTREADKLKGFLRFREVEGEIMYGEIEPSCNVIEILAHHFADRFPLMTFIITDKKRGISAVYNGEITLTTLSLSNVLKNSKEEENYQQLWREFMDSLNIKERKNPKCQRTLMPKKYWKYMLETQPDIKGNKLSKT